MMKIVPYSIPYTSIFVLKIFEHQTAIFELLQF
jgi:hypothetical protein